MTEPSSYLQYLPSVLWAYENDRDQFLGKMLRIFEKILTGIPDDVVIGDSRKSCPSLEERIDSLPSFFNPWRTPVDDFLPWLASWVALGLRSDWTEYQRRKITAGIVSVYRQRGLTQGLYTYLDIYAQTRARPRIAIDDGKAVLRLRFLPDGTARLTTVACSQVVSFPETPDRAAVHTPVLIHPSAIAIDSRNDYLVVDQGVAEDSDLDELRMPSLWKISSTGGISYMAGTPLPVPRALQSGSFFQAAVAVVVDDQDRCSVISARQRILRRFTPPEYAPRNVIDKSSTPRLPVIRPVDMVLDKDQNFIILDRGAQLAGDPPAGGPAITKLVLVRENPLAVEEHPLPDVVEPTALVSANDGTFIVADAKQATGTEPADLWRVNPSDNWSAVSLLHNVPPEANPLIFPTGVVVLSPSVLLVCDTGLRWGFEPDQGNRTMAEPASIFRIDLNRTPPVITRLTREPGLVYPAKMVEDRQGKIIVVDYGESLRDSKQQRSWRARPNEFGVVVHFSQQRPTTSEERNRTWRGIANVIDEQKPGHISWWLKSR
jgi:phage tail-like protein